MVFETEAIVLKTYNFSEADKIIVLLTKAEGKIRAVAKSVRKSTSKLAGSLGLLTHSILQLSGHEHRDLFRLTQAQLLTAFPSIKSDLSSLAQASRMTELVDGMTHDRHPVPELFALLKNGLTLLEKGLEPGLAAIWFEVRFWQLLGYRLNIESCFLCKQETYKMTFDLDAGGIVCHNCRPVVNRPALSKGARQLLAKVEQINEIYLNRLVIQKTMEKEIRSFLDQLIKFHLGRLLKSDGFRDAVRKLD